MTTRPETPRVVHTEDGMRVVASVLSLLLSPALVPLSAQVQPPVESGARVRVSTYPTQAMSVGTCLGFEKGHLQFAPSGMAIHFSIPVDIITALEVSRGRRSQTGQGVKIGLWVGTIGGVMTGLVVSDELCGPGREYVCAAVGAAEGAILGTLVGLAIGAMARTDRWEEVPLDQLRVSFVPQRDGRLAFGISLGF